jgi:DNA-damage-inducible protein J
VARGLARQKAVRKVSFTAARLHRSNFVATLWLNKRSYDMATDSVVRARIDAATKDQATEALAAMGLSVSDAIRLLLVRVAADKEFPFPVKVPNATTRKAMAELENGKGKRFASADELFKDLGI